MTDHIKILAAYIKLQVIKLLRETTPLNPWVLVRWDGGFRYIQVLARHKDDLFYLEGTEMYSSSVAFIKNRQCCETPLGKVQEISGSHAEAIGRVVDDASRLRRMGG